MKEDISARLAPGEARAVEVAALACRCSRCDAEFLVFGASRQATPAPPARCRDCRSPYWRVARGTLQRGRPSQRVRATCARCARGFTLGAVEIRSLPEGWELDARCVECRAAE
jgi:DNA-directed RNA polymerase subunit RPC12/RpoP